VGVHRGREGGRGGREEGAVCGVDGEVYHGLNFEGIGREGGWEGGREGGREGRGQRGVYFCDYMQYQATEKRKGEKRQREMKDKAKEEGGEEEEEVEYQRRAVCVVLPSPFLLALPSGYFP